MTTRYFLKVSAQMEPTAVIRLTIDPDRQQIRDQFWNPSMTAWEDDSYGMRAITLGMDNVREVGEQDIVKIFPDCPVGNDLS